MKSNTRSTPERRTSDPGTAAPEASTKASGGLSPDTWIIDRTAEAEGMAFGIIGVPQPPDGKNKLTE